VSFFNVNRGVVVKKEVGTLSGHQVRWATAYRCMCILIELLYGEDSTLSLFIRLSFGKVNLSFTCLSKKVARLDFLFLFCVC